MVVVAWSYRSIPIFSFDGMKFHSSNQIRNPKVKKPKFEMSHKLAGKQIVCSIVGHILCPVVL